MNMETLSEIAIKIFIEAILISGIIGYFFTKREERMKKTIEEEFSKRDKFFDVRFMPNPTLLKVFVVMWQNKNKELL
jgi:hypothetical protein